MRYRRYLLGKRKLAESWGNLGTASAYHALQEQQPGTPLPAGFLFTARLATAGYTTVDDIDGATVDELCDAGFSTMEADAILAAASRLTPAVP